MIPVAKLIYIEIKIYDLEQESSDLLQSYMLQRKQAFISHLVALNDMHEIDRGPIL